MFAATVPNAHAAVVRWSLPAVAVPTKTNEGLAACALEDCNRESYQFHGARVCSARIIVPSQGVIGGIGCIDLSPVTHQ